LRTPPSDAPGGSLAELVARTRRYVPVETPQTNYVRTEDGAYLAYQVFGDGPVDMLWFHGFVGSLEVMWEHRSLASLSEALTSVGRVIRYDIRATGLSDRAHSLPDLETQAQDARAVLDAVGSHSTVIVGVGGGSYVAALFAATLPARTRALCLWGASGRAARSPDYPWGASEEEIGRTIRRISDMWGTEAYAAAEMAAAAPSMKTDRQFIRWIAKLQRHWVTPGAAAELMRRHYETDIRQILPAIHVPTLVLAREWDGEEDAYIASVIPDARLVRLPGADLVSFVGDQESVIRAIRDFLGMEGIREPARSLLKSVVFTDIVDSSETLSRLGNRAWKDLVERHHALVRSELTAFNGTEVDTAGDGFYATFDGPANAVRCALAIVDRVKDLGIKVRAGVHTGEGELIDGKFAGLSVVLGARVAARAGASEVLVSQTVKDLVAGSGLVFENAGEHELRGVPDRWRLYRVVSESL
jgi:pimeloyl-ACP methyl ester carboxylesterase